MFDRSAFWLEAPNSLMGPGLAVRILPPQPQLMVSGDLDRFLTRHSLPPAGGLLAEMTGSRFALRLARNRMLVVGMDLPPRPPVGSMAVP
jgi:hypothetical protein